MNKEKLLVSAILFNHNVPKNEAKIIGALIENLEQQCKKQKEAIDKASNDLQQIMNNINDKTIISFGQFVSKLEVIQDELGGANDILKEVSE